jgi:hypothetical protein
MEDKTMAEVTAVIGYLPDAQAKALAAGKETKDPVLVNVEQGSDEMHVRIAAKDIAGTLLGASKKGQTAVQVFLRDKASVEMVNRGIARDFLLRPIKDLSLVLSRGPLVSIFASPQLIKQLVDAQRQELSGQ